jgi:hypothetical protein
MEASEVTAPVWHRLAEGAMAAEWFVAREGQQTLGPLSGQQLKQMVAAGQVQAHHLVWRQGMPKWVAAGQVKGLLGGSGEIPTLTSAPALDVTEAAEPERRAEEPSQPAAAADKTEPQEHRPEPREPWYYDFLQKYAKVGMWLGVLVCVLGFFWVLLVGVGALVLSGDRLEGFALLLVVVSMVVGGLFFGLVLLAILLQGALVLLALDNARHLRSVQRKPAKP